LNKLKEFLKKYLKQDMLFFKKNYRFAVGFLGFEIF
jgi:thiaminase